MSNYFKTSPGIATASGMAAAISMKLGLDYSKQSEEAKKNADDIQKIIDNFTDSISEFCPQGRDSLTQPKCYCYNTDGSRNENRSNSQTCQTLWAANETNIFKEAGDYSKIASVASLGCVTQNGDFDQNCDCKKFANASGENACYKSKYFGSNLGNLGSQLSLPAIGQGINALAQGDYSGAQGLANTNNANLAVKNQKIARQMLDQLNAKNKKPLRIDAKMADDLVRSVASNKALNTGRGLLGEGLDTLNNPGSAAPATGAEQIKEAINKAGLDKPQVDFQKDEDSGKTKGSDDYNLNFKGDEQSNSTTTPSVQNFMNKQYDFKDNDINRKSSESIWNIISNRYTQSGLRRLFNE
ncbi:MAG: hypothetical protein A2451_07450 [Bdellovibrionales bacterium RIFOXYC2_FULL_39_8]|nr:MAG: hypothetical protein A2451_07450 [Bdellovibrionales bacterium RIFOXYC2_FULL_39_8]